MIKSQGFIIFVGCEKFTKICPCGAMDTRLRGYDECERGARYGYDEEAGTGGGWDDSKLLKPCVVIGK